MEKLRWKVSLKYFVILILFFLFYLFLDNLLYNLRFQNKIEQQKKTTNEMIQEIRASVSSKIYLELERLVIEKWVLDQVYNSHQTDQENTLSTLNTTKTILKASLVYILDAKGKVIACTPYGKDNKETLTGKNFSFREYYKKAIAGKPCLYPAVGTVTNKRGLYFSAPIRSKTNKESIIAVVVIKMPLNSIDNILYNYPDKSALISNEGIIFACNQDKRWLYKSTQIINQKENIIKSKQFGNYNIKKIDIDLNQNELILDQKKYTVVKQSLPFLNNWNLVTIEPLQKNFQLTDFQLKTFLLFILFLISLLAIIIIELSLNNRKIYQQNNELKEMIHLVSHDLINPLGFIKSTIQLIKSQKKPLPLLKYIHEFDIAIDKTLQIVNLTRNLRAIEENKIEIELSLEPLKDCVIESLDILKYRIQEKNLKINLEINEHILVNVDREIFINSVLNNILTNAIKFSESHTNISIQAYEKNRMIYLEIQDQGIGIPEKLLEKLFELNTVTTRVGTQGEQGSGFGMQMIQKFVTRFHGKLIIESKEKPQNNHGTKITVILPEP